MVWIRPLNRNMLTSITLLAIYAFNIVHNISSDVPSSGLINPVFWGRLTVIEPNNSEREFWNNVCEMGCTVNADWGSLVGDKFSQLIVPYFWTSKCPLYYHQLVIPYRITLGRHSRYPK
jgi:hypothetical protein